jgi:hypothetical protein
VNLAWLSEQTGVMESTLRTHYGEFIHASQADALELAKIDADVVKKGEFVPRLPHDGQTQETILDLQRKNGGAEGI